MPRLPRAGHGPAVYFAVGVFVVVAGLCTIFWALMEADERQRIRTRTSLTAEQVAIRLESFVALRLELACELRDELDDGTITSRKEFEQHATEIRRHFPTFVALNWIDPEGVVRWIVAEDENREAVGRPLAEHPVAGSVLAATAEAGETRLTTPLELHEGGLGVAAYVPVTGADGPGGFVNAVFRLDPLIGHCLARGVTDNFCYELHDGEQLVHAFEPEEEELGHEPYVARVPVRVADRIWILTLCPNKSQLAAAFATTDELVLVAGLAFGLVLAGLIWWSLRNRLELLDSEAHLCAVAQHVPGVIYTYESSPGQPRRLLYLGPGLETLVGPVGAAAVAKDLEQLWELIHPEDRAPLGREARTGEETGLTVDMEIRLRTDSGDYRWVRSLAQPLATEDDTTRWHVVLIDISEQKHAEDNLRDARVRLEHLVAASPTVIYSRKPGGDQPVTFVSPNVAMLLGLPHDAFTADPAAWDQRVHPDDRQTVLDHVSRLMEHGHGEAEFRVRHSDGHYLWVQDAARVDHDPAGGPIEIVGTWQDITERHRDAERQKLMMNELDHRVKNNLAAVQALADLTLATSGSLESFRESFSGRIHAMARAHEAMAQHRWEGVKLGDIIHMTVEPYARGSVERVTTTGESVMLPSRVASPLCLACHELATNAAKYGALSSAEGHVDIAWRTESGSIVVSWIERGGPAPQTPAEPGFGLQLLSGLVERELGGSAVIEFRPEGLACEMTVPLRHPAKQEQDHGQPVAA